MMRQYRQHTQPNPLQRDNPDGVVQPARAKQHEVGQHQGN